MSIDLNILNQSANQGSLSASKALSVMTNRQIEVETSKVSSTSLDKLVEMVSEVDPHQVVAYSQLISGLSGVALLVLDRNDALNLIDILTNKKPGETIVLKELDRSAIKETLNILSNSHLTALASKLGVTVNLAPPSLISKERIATIIDYIAKELGESKEVVVFETRLLVKEASTKINLYLIFGTHLSGILKS